MKLNKGDVVRLYNFEELLHSKYWFLDGIILKPTARSNCCVTIPIKMWAVLGKKMKIRALEDNGHFSCYNNIYTYHTTMIKEVLGRYEVE